MIITFFNHKGGVGKTTLATLMSDYLTKLDRRVLLVDFDPQGSLSEVFLTEEPSSTLVEYFQGLKTLGQCVTTISDKISLLASDMNLSSIPFQDSVYLERRKPNFLSVFKDFDDVIIDLPPYPSHWLPRLGIKLSNFIIMPNKMDKLSYDALRPALEEIELFKSPDLIQVFAIENEGKKQRVVVKENYRDLFKRDLGDSFLDVKLLASTAIIERTVQDINFFEEKSSAYKNANELFSTLYGAIYGETA